MQVLEAFHIQQLQSTLLKRKQINPRYSLRSLARDLEMSPAALCRLLAGKKGVSHSRALSIAKKLRLTRTDLKMFLLSVTAHHARSRKEREKAAQEIELLLKRMSRKSLLQLEGPSGQLCWEHLAVLELFEIGGGFVAPEWLMSKLSLTSFRVHQILGDLLALNMISEGPDGYSATSEESETTFDIPSTALKNFHAKILLRAQASLFQDDISSREFLSMTFAFNTEQLEEAKESIRDFQETFSQRFATSKKKKNAVYQLAIQLFRLDKEIS